MENTNQQVIEEIKKNGCDYGIIFQIRGRKFAMRLTHARQSDPTNAMRHAKTIIKPSGGEIISMRRVDSEAAYKAIEEEVKKENASLPTVEELTGGDPNQILHNPDLVAEESKA